MYYHQFSTLRKICKKRSRFDQKEYLCSHMSDVSDPKSLWSTFRQITGKKMGVGTLDESPKGNAASNSNKAELLSDYFRNSFNSVDIPSFSLPDCIFPSECCIDVPFISEQFAKLCLQKSAGSDNILPIFLRMGSPILAPAFAVLFNRCFRDFSFPTILKSAICHPIPKVPNPSSVTHYRPISILPTCTKIYERHIVNLLTPFILPKLSDFQFAFRPKCSTNDANF